MLAYALAIFTGAFLLFQVQPLIAKFILPWFGGSPGVWTTCLLFFQLLLLGGYAFAHLIASRLGPRGQAIAYGTALLVAMAFLPIVPPEGLKPDADTVPTLRILVLLGVSVGFPYLVLASTSPLMQSWFSRTLPDASPYRLYALSNAGSLLALLSYPFVTEPLLSRQTQAYVWSFAFVTYALLGGYCALRLVRHDASGEAEPETPTAFALAWRPAVSARFLWVLLPACGSLLLLAITNELTIDIAPVPFLWVLPLSIYLLTFIISFDHERWYSRPVFFAALVGCLIAILPMLGDTVDASLGSQIAALSISLFVFCMICHGELARHKPPARFLTSYYLSIAAGGARGSLFVAVVAPLIFTADLELHIGLVLCCLLFMASVWTSPRSWLHGGRPRWAWMAMALVLLAFGATLTVGAATELAAATEMSRNFYGVLSITDVLTGTPGHTVKLNHGRILHGLQFVHAARTLFPTSYYGGLSGAGLALRAFPRQGARRIGLVGLGVGTLTAYSRPGEYVRIYEINPEVKRLAETRFTFLSHAAAEVDIVMGDARLSMEREDPQEFDVLLLDAFSSDAIPVHLLTVEAFETYLRHLRPDGVLGVHISNRHLELKPVVARLAEHFGLEYRQIINQEDNHRGVFTADWMLLTSNQEFLSHPAIKQNALDADDVAAVALWTDDYVNILEIVSW